MIPARKKEMGNPRAVVDKIMKIAILYLRMNECLQMEILGLLTYHSENVPSILILLLLS